MPEIHLIYLQKIRFVFKAEARVSERLYLLITNSSSSQKLGFANSNVDHNLENAIKMSEQKKMGIMQGSTLTSHT